MIPGSRQLNSVESGIALYNVAVVCFLDKGALIEDVMKQCIDHVETAFFYDQSISCSGTGLNNNIICNEIIPIKLYRCRSTTG